MAPRRADGTYAAALYVRDKEQDHRQLRIFLPEERVSAMRLRYQMREWDGVDRMRVRPTWVEKGSVISLVFVEERCPKGVPQPGNALILEPNEATYYVSFGTQAFVEGMEPFGATVCEDVTWFDNGVQLTLCPNGAPYEPRSLSQPRRSPGNGGVPRGEGHERAAKVLPAPNPWDVNLVSLLGLEEHPAMMDLRAALGLVKEATDRMRADGWKVQLNVMTDGTPRVTAYPDVLSRFISLPRWQAVADPAPLLDTNVTNRSLPSGSAGGTVPPDTKEP